MFTKSKRVFTEHIYVPYGQAWRLFCGVVLLPLALSGSTSALHDEIRRIPKLLWSAMLNPVTESLDTMEKHKWRDLRTVLGLKYLYILDLFSNKEPGTWQVVQNSEFKNWLPFNWVWIWIELAALYRKLNWKTGRGMYWITIYRDLTQVMQYFSTLNCPST